MTDPKNILTDADKIKHFFDKKGIHWESWGQNGSWPFERLMQYIDEDEVELVDTGGIPLLHVCNVVAYVWNMRTPLQELYEACQISGNGPPNKRHFDGISETVVKGEPIEDAVQRLMAEEPGYSEKGFRDPRNYAIFKRMARPVGPIKSKKWPGDLEAMYSRDCFQVNILNQAIYNPDGYFEVRDGITTVLKWMDI